MGLFNKLKRDIKAAAKQVSTPKGMVSYRGVQFSFVSDEASLPDDKNILKQMAKYYDDRGVCQDREAREEKRNMILKKTYPLVKDDTDYDSERVIELYYKYLCTQDDLNEYGFQTFIDSIKKAVPPMEEFNQKAAEGKSVFPASLFFMRFVSSKVEDSYVEQNIMTLLNTVWELVEKEKAQEQPIYLGYYMFKDLYHHYQNGGPHVQFKKDIWKESSRYYTMAHSIYNLAPVYLRLGEKAKAKIQLDKKPELKQMNEHAKNNLHLLNKEEFLARFNAIQSGVAERDAKYERGKMLLSSYLTETEKQEGIRLMKEAAADHHPTARNEMIQLLVEENDPEALTEFAYDHLEGKNNIKKDPLTAIELFKKAARVGSAEACYYLSKAYEQGSYVLQDKQRGLSLLMEAAKSNYGPALSDLADMESTNGNQKEALALYKKILQLDETEKNIRSIQHAIAQIVDTLIPSKGSHFDVDENTLGLCSLVFDYVRMDAPMVSNYDLNEMLDRAKNLEASAVNQLSVYYQIESRGPQAMGTIPGSKIYNEDRPRAYDMMKISKAFDLIYIALHTIKLFHGETKSIYELAVSYFEGRNYEKARAYVDLGIQLDIPSVLGYVHKVWDKLGYDEWFAQKCLEKAAKLGNTTAQLDLEYNAMLSESERERKEYVKRILEDQEESRRALRRIGIDLLERDIDIMLGGTGHNLDENALLSKLSFADAANLRALRKRLLDEN